MTTGEETEGGGSITGIGSFAKYPDYASCIKQRAWMLKRDPYASKVNPYRNQNDGKYSKEAAQGYIEGIRLAGWATSSSYVKACIGHMDTYNLYRFDNMTYEEYKKSGSGNYDGVETELMKRIAAIARENQGLYPAYTPDMCAAWVTGVYQAAEAPEIPYGNAIDMWNTLPEYRKYQHGKYTARSDCFRKGKWSDGSALWTCRDLYWEWTGCE